ncbi:hypothetical protein LJC63_01155 [Ruminococcaceae bacterium OttesenSCG-928-L11]|nr:hypothetical protein [Ruminococcaceae bacterium OttesenSCG-928-L11]
MDSGNERAESDSGGNDTQRAGLCVESDDSQLGNSSIEELLSTSAISVAEVDAILRDGGNFDNHKLDSCPFNSRSSLRIAAHFTKNLDDNADFLRREYLGGRYGHGESESGKGFDFGNHRVCEWFDTDGISLAVGSTAKHNIHRITIPWELAAARISELMFAGEYLSRGTFENALDNEKRELSEKLWHFYRDNIGELPQEWRTGKYGSFHEDTATIQTLLDDADECRMILERLEIDIAVWEQNPERHGWHNPYRLLSDMRNFMLPSVILPNEDFELQPSFSYFITQDEIDHLLTRGGGYSEGKLRLLSYFLGDHTDKEKADFIKEAYGHGGGTWSETDGWHDSSPGKGVTLSRGRLSSPSAEINLKWNAAAKRVSELIRSGHFATQADLDAIPNYERIILARCINNFYHELPPEYERPFEDKLDFYYPHRDEWEAIRDLLDNPDHVDALIAAMEPVYQNTIPEDRYYQTRKYAWDSLTAYRDGTYTLFPGIENLPAPGTPMFRRAEPRRRDRIEDLRDNTDFFTDEPQEVEQLSIFGGSFPILPGVEEQRTIIEAKPVVEPIAAPEIKPEPQAFDLQDISDADKARLTERFAENPRSRESVQLVREIYGDKLDIPLPQAIQQISALIAQGAFDAPYRFFEKIQEEISSRGFSVSNELIETAISDYNSRSGQGDFQDVADFIENEYLSEPDYYVGDRLLYNGKPHEICEIDDDYILLRNMDAAPNYPADALVSIGRDEFDRMLSDGDFIIGEPDDDVAEVSADIGNPYAVGNTVWLDDRKFIIDSISDYYKRPDDLDLKFGTYGREIKLTDITSGYPLSRSMYQAEVDFKLGLDERNNHLLPLGEEIEAPAPEVASTSEPEAISFDFDAIADEIYEQVLNDGEFAEILANATSRGVLRRPLNAALDAVIADYEAESQMYGYLSNDDTADSLFDHIYRKAWDEREVAQAPAVPENSTLEQAKALISAFAEQEYGSTADFSDMSNIGIAYTTNEDEQHEFQVSADLLGFRTKYFLDNICIKTEQYANLREMIDLELANLDFDTLITAVFLSSEKWSTGYS